MKDESQIACSYVVMTKERVDSLIACNTENRNLRSKVVDSYARDMTAGNWQTTHQGIAVSKCGRVIDGQHRLYALKKAGYPPIKMLLVSGLAFEVQKHVDQQAKRSVRDALKITFDANFAYFAPSIVRALIYAENGGAHATPTISEIAEKIEEYMDEIESITSFVKSSKFFIASQLAGFVRVMKDCPDRKEDILEFMAKVNDGAMLSKQEPAFHLRSFTINSASRKGGGSARKEFYNKTVKATIAHLEGKTIGVLRA